jgi:DnaK suppressor protein
MAYAQQMSIADDLTERRADLASELERLTRHPEAGASVSYGKRIGEGTAEAVERLSTTAAARSISSSIASIDRALEKVADGTYGVCDGCGREIAPARLEALPATARCFDCSGAG